MTCAYLSLHIDSVELTHYLGVADDLFIFVHHSLDSKDRLPERPFRVHGLGHLLLLLLLPLVAHSW